MKKTELENVKDDKRIKFTTTLKKTCLVNLAYLKYKLKLKNNNDVIEKIVEEYFNDISGCDKN